jgi:hypothetical protein
MDTIRYVYLHSYVDEHKLFIILGIFFNTTVININIQVFYEQKLAFILEKYLSIENLDLDD